MLTLHVAYDVDHVRFVYTVSVRYIAVGVVWLLSQPHTHVHTHTIDNIPILSMHTHSHKHAYTHTHTHTHTPHTDYS